VRVRPSPAKQIIDLVKAYPGITRTELAAMLDRSYWSIRYWCDKLEKEGKIKAKRIWTVRHTVRRVEYYPVKPPGVYYRTQVALMFYARVPRRKTPDPIAEFRVCVVSDKEGMYDIHKLERACLYIGVILAPQTYWIKQESIVTAREIDEPIDPDELELSVPVYKRLNYAERYACFFRSRRESSEWWRNEVPDYWEYEEAPVPLPRKGDYEYDEKYIKAQEDTLVKAKFLKYRFDNRRGEMVAVTE